MKDEDQKPSPEDVLKRAEELLSKPDRTMRETERLLRGKPYTYWIAYKVPTEPAHDSLSHCEYYSINVPPLTRPEDEENKEKAKSEFKTHKESELQQKIIILGVYQDSEPCKDAAEEENKKQEKIKSTIHLLSAGKNDLKTQKKEP